MSIELLTEGNLPNDAINFNQLVSSYNDKYCIPQIISSTKVLHSVLSKAQTSSTYVFWRFKPDFTFKLDQLIISCPSRSGNINATVYFFNSDLLTLRPSKQLFHAEFSIVNIGDFSVSDCWELTGPSSRESKSLTNFLFSSSKYYWIGFHVSSSAAQLRHIPLEATDTFIGTTTDFNKNCITVLGSSTANLYINSIEELGGSIVEAIQDIPQVRFRVFA